MKNEANKRVPKGIEGACRLLPADIIFSKWLRIARSGMGVCWGHNLEEFARMRLCEVWGYYPHDVQHEKKHQLLI